MKYYGDDLYYIDTKEFIKSIIAWVLFFIAILLLFINQSELCRLIINIIRLVVIITILMFITHSDNINPKPILKIVKFNLIIILSIFTIQLIPLEHLSGINYILVFSAENKNIDHGSIYLSIMYYILSRYEDDKSAKVEKEYKIILLVLIVLNVLSNFYFVNNIVIISTYAIIVQILQLISISNVLKHKLIVENKINVFSFTVISTFVWVNLMEIVGTFETPLLYSIIGGIGFAIFIASATVVIENISINMYNFIFKDIYDINRSLEKINCEILIRNEELEKSKKEIEIKQKNYRGLLNSFPKAIIIVSTINNRIIYCNSDFQKLIGVNSARKIINKKIENIFKLNANYVELESLKSTDLYLGNTIGKKIKQLEIRISNFNEGQKEITMTFEDITEKIKIEKIKGEIERKKTNDNIKKNFLSNVSHDFKIPINVIYSATQLENLLISNKDIKGVKKYNSISKQNCLTLIKLTNNIIDISKISAEYLNPTLTRGNIVEHIEDIVLSLVEYGKLNNIDIIFDTDNEELYMKYDGELMERIILNLISNAIKFTPENGNIIVGICSDDKKIYISVEDNGSGMDEKFVKEAFNKYSMDIQSVYGNVQGTGVGLYVVYNLVNLQNGQIWVDSEVGNGTKFTMKFNKE